MTHQPVIFACKRDELIGIIEHASNPQNTGVLIVTGGPQYRAGSHRQFVSIARDLATKGYSTMRFDYRGTGDSAGPETAFFETADDIDAAIDAFLSNTSIDRVLLMGLCDAASAAMIYAHQDHRVVGMILLNPWVRTDEGLAQAYVKNYYLDRLFSRAFWNKLTSGEFAWRKSILGFGRNILTTLRLRIRFRKSDVRSTRESFVMDFRERMRVGLEEFKGDVLFLLCGDDLTATEFVDYTKRNHGWREPMSRRSVTQLDLPDMDHTFSTSEWRSQVVTRILDWMENTSAVRVHPEVD